MAVFWLMASLMIVVSLLVVLPALTSTPAADDGERDATNRSLFKARLSSLDSLRRSGELSEHDYALAHSELERQMLNDLEDTDAGRTTARHAARLAVALATLVPLSALGLYLHFGTPDVLLGPSHVTRSAPQRAAATSGREVPHSIEDMVSGLEQRLQSEPENAEGWLMLGRSYAAMNRLTEARDALLEADRLRPDHPTTLVALAETIAGLSGNRLDGEPLRLVMRALEVEPGFARGLWLAGLGAYRAGEPTRALEHWHRLIEVPGLDERSSAQVRQAIASVERETGLLPAARETTTAAATAAVSVKVSLDRTLADRARPEDVVFVFARAAEGPRMPLAVQRLTVADLPHEVLLDDSMAMTPQLRLSSVPEVVIAARISRSGSATPSAGDLVGVTEPFRPSSQGVATVSINRIVE